MGYLDSDDVLLCVILVCRSELMSIEDIHLMDRNRIFNLFRWT